MFLRFLVYTDKTFIFCRQVKNLLEKNSYYSKLIFFSYSNKKCKTEWNILMGTVQQRNLSEGYRCAAVANFISVDRLEPMFCLAVTRFLYCSYIFILVTSVTPDFFLHCKHILSERRRENSKSRKHKVLVLFFFIALLYFCV